MVLVNQVLIIKSEFYSIFSFLIDSYIFVEKNLVCLEDSLILSTQTTSPRLLADLFV